MKLSEISTEKGLDTLCELTPAINNIMADESLGEELKRALKQDEIRSRAQMIAYGVEKINKIVPIVFKTHREDVLKILAIVNEKTVEEIGKQKMLTTMIQIRNMVKDKELVDFFKSCMDGEGNE